MDEDHYAELLNLDERLKVNGFAVVFSEVLVEDGEVEACGFVASLIWPPTTSLTHYHLSSFEKRWKAEARDRYGSEYSVSDERRDFDPTSALNFLRRVVTV